MFSGYPPEARALDPSRGGEGGSMCLAAGVAMAVNNGAGQPFGLIDHRSTEAATFHRGSGWLVRHQTDDIDHKDA